ncbi:MAG: LysR family transcriptional regulator [Pseudomonadota bacterium]
MRLKPSTSPELLELFTLVVQHGSIAGAARHMNIAPSLATRKIAQLEDGLNARLFERTTRSIKLTEAGEMALRWASQSLESQAQLIDDLAALQGTPSGLIRIMAVHYSAVAYLPVLLAKFCAMYPQIRISIATSDSPVNLVEGHYDLAVQSGRIPDSNVIGQRVREYQRILCATPGYVARKGTPAVPADLAAHDCLTHSTNETRTWFFLRGKKLVSRPIDPFIEVDNYSLLLELTRSSLGISRLSRTLVKQELASGKLVQLLPKYSCVYPDGELPGLWVLYPNRRVLGRTRLLIDYLVENLPEVMDPP